MKVFFKNNTKASKLTQFNKLQNNIATYNSTFLLKLKESQVSHVFEKADEN